MMCMQTQSGCWRREALMPRRGVACSLVRWADEASFSVGFFVMCVKAQFACGYPRVGFRLRWHAPRAGAGIYFLYEKKVNKDSPKGRVSILSPLEPPLNDQRRWLWKPGEASALVLFHTQARPACEAGV